MCRFLPLCLSYEVGLVLDGRVLVLLLYREQLFASGFVIACVAASGARGGVKVGACGLFFLIFGGVGCFVGAARLCHGVFPAFGFLLRPPGVMLLFVGLLAVFWLVLGL